VHRESSAQSVDGSADLIEDAGQLFRAEPGEAAGGGQQDQPLVAGVGLFPVESPLFGLVELSGLADLAGDLGVHRLVHIQRTATWRRGERRDRHHPPVGSGERLGHLGGRLVHMTEDRQLPGGPHDLGRLRGTRDWIDPVPRLGDDHRIEPPVVGFEGRYLDPKAAGAGEPGHPRIGLYAEHGAVSDLELAGCDVGATADVEHTGSGASGDDPRHEGIGVAGTSPVVALRVVAERLGGKPRPVQLQRRRSWLLLG
jgi:hypothetical protein